MDSLVNVAVRDALSAPLLLFFFLHGLKDLVLCDGRSRKMRRLIEDKLEESKRQHVVDGRANAAGAGNGGQARQVRTMAGKRGNGGQW